MNELLCCRDLVAVILEFKSSATSGRTGRKRRKRDQTRNFKIKCRNKEINGYLVLFLAPLFGLEGVLVGSHRGKLLLDGNNVIFISKSKGCFFFI